MSSPYWSQSNGRAEAAVKSAKHILCTAKDVDLALLSVRNTPPSGHTFSPQQFASAVGYIGTIQVSTRHSSNRTFALQIKKSKKSKPMTNMQDNSFKASHPEATSMLSLPLIHLQRPGSLDRSSALWALDLTLSKLAPDKSGETVFKCNWHLPQVPLPHQIRLIPLHSFLTNSDPTR